jgi:hypothetical protein
MRRCLIVANQTLTADTLSEAVEQRIAAEPHEFYVVAPATPLRDEVDGPEAYVSLGPSPTERAYALARQRLDRALDQLQELGASVDGEVGDPEPLEAVRVALGRFAADEIVISTLPQGCRTGCAGTCRPACARAAASRSRPSSPTATPTPEPDRTPGRVAQPGRRAPPPERWPELQPGTVSGHRPGHGPVNPVRRPGQAPP